MGYRRMKKMMAKIYLGVVLSLLFVFCFVLPGICLWRDKGTQAGICYFVVLGLVMLVVYGFGWAVNTLMDLD